MKTFLSTVTFLLSRAHLTTALLSYLAPRLSAGPVCFPGILTCSEEVAECSLSGGTVRGSQSCHGHVPGAERVSGALGAPFAWCRQEGSCGRM